ncbi:MAG: VCBS repeat-containing protein, partial [Bacteroidaceae bacterium]|nr:VCBS repeat-containing protein [Bacteroidaceae bacterium]
MKAKQLLAMAALFSAATVMAEAVVPSFEVQQDGSFIYEMGERGTIAYADYNNDGYMDCLMFRNGADPMLWKNNGDKTFTNVIEEQEDLLYAKVFGAAAMWYDYDNDGNLDLIVTGCMTQGDASTAVLYTYHNNGSEENYYLEEIFEPYIGQFKDELGSYNMSLIPHAAREANKGNFTHGTVSMNYGKEMINAATPEIALGITSILKEDEDNMVNITNGSYAVNLG